MFIGLEMQSLALYLLIGLHHEEKNVTEAVIKYFVLGAIATGFVLFGISFIYGFSGTTNFSVLEQVIATHPPMGYAFFVGLALMICGFAFKLSAVPFHMWSPDVYQGTPYPTMLFLATAPKITVIAFLMRFLCGPVFNIVEKWQTILIVLALASMVLGAIATLMQTNIRRFLAYASISSVGFSLVGIALASEDGLRSSLFYSILYIVAMVGFLTCIMILLRRGFQVENLSDLRGLATEKPFLSLSSAILVLSMSGLPPFPGFLGKLFLLQAVL
jgi:NADH-quinone oxidoreductase subunit N